MKLVLEIEEDTLWGALAAKRDTRGAQFVSHKKAWVYAMVHKRMW